MTLNGRVCYGGARVDLQESSVYVRWVLEQECLDWAGRSCADGAVFETNAETGLLQIREIKNKDGRGIPGVHARLLVPQGSADN